ncbi:hypothetical protein DY000_02007211 [Brassica cretica]|uniref:Uncharacterized protein n=1 Tax=Brassica cretica TaxID=69181 RepID=A0ABQ7BY20_BRACR|nr:hypothetical protein DY000_02007211 [Brassica cretica]
MDDVPLIEGDQNRYLKVGSKLTEGLRRRLIDFLRSNFDYFDWSNIDMYEIDPETIMHKEFLSEKAQGHLSKGTTGKPTEAAPASPPQQDRVIHVISGGSEICGSQAKTSAPGYGRNKLHGQGTKKGSHPTSRRPGHIAHCSELPGEKHTGR